MINAALTLAARPQSKVAQDNMDVFKDQWEKQVRILTEAVDDITSVDDFLSVSGMPGLVPSLLASRSLRSFVRRWRNVVVFFSPFRRNIVVTHMFGCSIV